MFLFKAPELFNEIKELLIEWITNNYNIYKTFFSYNEVNNIDKETQAKLELEYMK